MADLFHFSQIKRNFIPKMDEEPRPSRMQRPSGSGFGANDDEQYSLERRENTKGAKAGSGARGRQNRSSGDSR